MARMIRDIGTAADKPAHIGITNVELMLVSDTIATHIHVAIAVTKVIDASVKTIHTLVCEHLHLPSLSRISPEAHEVA
jgi:hypothetical protein